jgi:hypothetical protein
LIRITAAGGFATVCIFLVEALSGLSNETPPFLIPAYAIVEALVLAIALWTLGIKKEDRDVLRNYCPN